MKKMHGETLKLLYLFINDLFSSLQENPDYDFIIS